MSVLATDSSVSVAAHPVSGNPEETGGQESVSKAGSNKNVGITVLAVSLILGSSSLIALFSVTKYATNLTGKVKVLTQSVLIAIPVGSFAIGVPLGLSLMSSESSNKASKEEVEKALEDFDKIRKNLPGEEAKQIREMLEKRDPKGLEKLQEEQELLKAEEAKAARAQEIRKQVDLIKTALQINPDRGDLYYEGGQSKITDASAFRKVINDLHEQAFFKDKQAEEIPFELVYPILRAIAMHKYPDTVGYKGMIKTRLGSNHTVESAINAQYQYGPSISDEMKAVLLHHIDRFAEMHQNNIQFFSLRQKKSSNSVLQINELVFIKEKADGSEATGVAAPVGADGS